MSSDLDGIARDIDAAIAAGLNQAAEIELNDIRAHVQIKTGRLRDSYAIVRRATPDDLNAEVSSDVDYRVHHYPLALPPAPPERNRSLQGNPLVNPTTGDTSQLEERVAEAIATELNRRLGG
jgi:hypothetical protein